MNSSYDEWDQIYRKYPLEELGWKLGRPRPILVEFIEKGFIKKGKALDIYCGAGTNTVYLAEKGFEVTGIGISSKAIAYAKKKAKQANVNINLMAQNFLNLPFEKAEFDFVFDMGPKKMRELRFKSFFKRLTENVVRLAGFLRSRNQRIFRFCSAFHPNKNHRIRRQRMRHIVTSHIDALIFQKHLLQQVTKTVTYTFNFDLKLIRRLA